MSRLLPVIALLATIPTLAGATVVTAPWSPKGGQAGAAFGTSVAPAGDVDGDGYSDVLVGAPLFDNGQLDEGRAYLYKGGPNGLAASPAWTWEPNQANAQAGALVTPAGDINRDGYFDVLVGAPLYDRPGHVDAGAVFVFYGSPTGLALVPDDTLANDVTGARFGTSAAAAGDVNKDFWMDVIVGAPGFANGQANEGAAYVFHGSLDGISTVAARTVEGGEVDARAGQAVSSAGDVNADTYADVLVGAPGASPNGIVAAGSAYLLAGSASGVNPVAIATVSGTADSMTTGAGVSLAGDMDGDGYADVVIGSPGADMPFMRSGRFTIYRGSATGLDPTPLLDQGGPSIQSRVGASVATAGDMDGDGYGDLVVGNERYVSGSQIGLATIHYGTRIGPLTILPLPGTQANGHFGASVATAADFDGDGIAELLVGAPAFSEPLLALEGAAFSFLGRPGPLTPGQYSPMASNTTATTFASSLAILPTSSTVGYPSLLVGESGYDAVSTNAGRVRRYSAGREGFIPGNFDSYAGTATDGLFGEVVVDVGDVDRDGWGDFVAGSPFYSSDGVSERGRAVLYLGSDQGFAPSPWVGQGAVAEERYGSAIAGRGDVNGDGYADVAIGGYNYVEAAVIGGRVRVFHGGPDGLSPIAAWEKKGTANAENFGYKVAMLDFDADGYSDLAVSAASTAPTRPPRVDIFYGGPGGLSTTAAFSLTPTPSLSTYGSALSGVGDYNCDGVADLVVSAPDEPAGQGTIFFYPGSRGRGFPYPVRSWTPGPGEAQAGYALAGGGDLDGDGRSDFVVGAPNASHPELNEGVLYVFRGRPGNGGVSPDTLLESNVVSKNLGSALSPLADLNADGYADIIAGATGDNGAVYGWLGGGEGAYQWLAATESCCNGLRRLTPALLDSTTKVGAVLMHHSAAGRSRLSVQFEILPQLQPFTNVANFADAPFVEADTGPAGPPGNVGPIGTYVRFLWPAVTYHWRGRSTNPNPHFPHSRWLPPEGRSSGDFNFRTGGANTGVADLEFAPVARLGRIAPNPSAAAVGFAYDLPARVPLRIDLYDVRGRHVRALVREATALGRGTASWDGTDATGRKVPPGIYFVELRAGDAVDRARMVRLR